MKDKERLEEIKSRVWKDKGTYAMGDYSQREGYIYTLSDYDYEWLIEQAERVQELETFKEEMKNRYKIWHIGAKKSLAEKEELKQQNKRYREALELIKRTNPVLVDKQWFIDVANQATELNIGMDFNYKIDEVEVEDLEFLIQNGFKQAKQVEELEENNRAFRKNNKRLRKQNKRYREVLVKLRNDIGKIKTGYEKNVFVIKTVDDALIDWEALEDGE